MTSVTPATYAASTTEKGRGIVLRPSARISARRSELSNAFSVELPLGQTPWFKVVSGQVIEESRRTETSLQHTATIVATAYGSSGTSSATTTHNRTHAVWLVLEDGKEMELELPSHDFSVRAGHRFSIAWGGKEGSESGPYVAAVNHATGATWKADDEGLKPVVTFDMSLWGKVLVVSSAIGLLGGLAGGVAIGLGLMMGPAELIAYLGVVAAKIPGQMRLHMSVSLAVDQLLAAMQVDEGRVSDDVLAKRVSARNRGTEQLLI